MLITIFSRSDHESQIHQIDMVSISTQDPRLPKVGFAKLIGKDLDYTMRKYEITLGRKSKQDIDVILGETQSLSRHHATIKYNFVTRTLLF